MKCGKGENNFGIVTVMFLNFLTTTYFTVNTLKFKLRDSKCTMVYDTVKFLNFRMPENFAVIYLKFKQRGQTLGCFCQNDTNGRHGIANSEDPDQTAPLGAV